jgi:hypothetical protein
LGQQDRVLQFGQSQKIILLPLRGQHSGLTHGRRAVSRKSNIKNHALSLLNAATPEQQADISSQRSGAGFRAGLSGSVQS